MLIIISEKLGNVSTESYLIQIFIYLGIGYFRDAAFEQIMIYFKKLKNIALINEETQLNYHNAAALVARIDWYNKNARAGVEKYEEFEKEVPFP